MTRGTGTRLLPLAAFVLAVAGLAVMLGGRDRPLASDVAKADDVGSAYFSNVATFKARLMRRLERNRGAHAAQLRDIVDAQLKAAPTLAPPPKGAEKSHTYQEAVKAQPTILAPVTRLRSGLDAAAQAEAFVAGADDALDRANVHLRAAAAMIGVETIKKRTLPAVRRARDDFRRLLVPADARATARVVGDALSSAVRELETLVSRVEAGHSYAFDLTNKFVAADKALHDYAVVTDGNLAEDVARLRDRS